MPPSAPAAIAPSSTDPLEAPPPEPPSRPRSQSVPAPHTPADRERIGPLPHSPASRAFRRRNFPDASLTEWNDWRWQSRNRIRSLDQLERVFRLTGDERAAVARQHGPLPVGITPYYAALMSPDDPADPLRRTHLPTLGEFLRMPGEADDPLGEDQHQAVPGLVHRYPDRVLFLATGTCSTYCRYCTRSRMVGGGGEISFSLDTWQRAIDYIAANPAIRDVLLSGGDPLTIGTARLDWLLGRLRAIPHVEFLRLGTKVPIVLPQRITRELVAVLRRHHPLWMSVHVTHPDELTPESITALARLADAGIPLGSQTVLLAGINDDAALLKRLFHRLLANRVRPYYLYQCDPISGSAHFRTPVSKGLEIIEALRGHTTGYAVPHFVVDAPGGGGKIALLPDAVVGRDGADLLLRNFEGKVWRYPDPAGAPQQEAPLRRVGGVR